MAMGYVHADSVLDAVLNGGTPHLMLHTGNPDADATANEAQVGTADIARKPVTFGVSGPGTSATEQYAANSASVSWAGTEIDSGQEITHFSIWNATTAGSVLFIATIQTSKTTGSDGVTVGTSDLECAIAVFETG